VRGCKEIYEVPLKLSGLLFLKAWDETEEIEEFKNDDDDDVGFELGTMFEGSDDMFTEDILKVVLREVFEDWIGTEVFDTTWFESALEKLELAVLVYWEANELLLVWDEGTTELSRVEVGELVK
jgi:hypothetical protein